MGHVMATEYFIQAYDDLSDAIFRHCLFRLSDRERALDATQETFMRVWKYISEGNRIENIKAFLYRVANNIIIDEYRKKRPQSLDLLQDEGFDPVGEGKEEIIEAADAGIVIEHITRLPDHYRDVIVMRYIDGLSVKEIALIIGESENNVSVRISRGLNKVRSLLLP